MAGRAAAARVTGELRALFALDAAEQRMTPLEVVRTAVREPSEVLERAGVPPVVRDAFDEQAWPDDRYGLVPRTLGDLGEADLGPLQLAWGLAKTKVLRARGRRLTPAATARSPRRRTPRRGAAPSHGSRPGRPRTR